MRLLTAILIVGFLVMSRKVEARGYRNNNPLNIKNTGIHWEGMVETQTDPVFVQFVSPEYGYRAGAKILKTYINKYNLRTIRQIISRWAPTSENDTESYIRFVSEFLGYNPDTVMDWFDIPRLLQAMTRFENGYIKHDIAMIEKGVKMV